MSDAPAVRFECPRCGAEYLAETSDGVVVPAPVTCSFGHAPTEMEQRLLDTQHSTGGGDES